MAKTRKKFESRWSENDYQLIIYALSVLECEYAHNSDRKKNAQKLLKNCGRLQKEISNILGNIKNKKPRTKLELVS